MDNVLCRNRCLIPGCVSLGTYRAPGGSMNQNLCCRHFEELCEHVVDPETNPVFPRVLG
jgi:hypothetical protein